MTGATPTTPYESTVEASRIFPATAARRRASTRQLLPIHRLTVITKTPLLVALGVYMSGAHFAWPTIGATLVLSSLMWGVLYAVNEAFDLTLEEGYIVPRATIAALMACVVAACLIAFVVSPALALLFGLMTAGQLA